MNRRDRRTLARRITTGKGLKGTDKSDMRRTLANDLLTGKVKLEDPVRPKIRDLGQGVGVTDSGLVVPSHLGGA